MSNLGRVCVFCNSKGGVGKSTISFLGSLSLYMIESDRQTTFVDLDSQATSITALQKFTNSRFTIENCNSYMLETGQLNAGALTQFLTGRRRNGYQVIVDMPAASRPQDLIFVGEGDIVFIPTSASDADIAATHTFLQTLLVDDRRGKASPFVVVLPNMIDDDEDMQVIRRAFWDFPVFLGRPFSYNRDFRKIFRNRNDDTNILRALQAGSEYFTWMHSVIYGGAEGRIKSSRLSII